MTELEQEYNYTPLAKPLRITEHSWPEGTVPLVSITCITYNHVNFIRDAIEGFLMQETTFPVEILIHDDASTDGTADIVRDYEARYPKLIRAICQEENQYSKGRLTYKSMLINSTSKYIAMIEGDDYWIDKKKLSKQAIFLEKHSDYSACFHNIELVWQGVSPIPNFYPKPLIDPTFQEIIKHKRYVHTSSIFLRSEYVKNMPGWLSVIPSAHTSWIYYLRTRGRTYFIDEKMSVHRKHADGMYFNPQTKPNILLLRTLVFEKKKLLNNWFQLSVQNKRQKMFQLKNLLNEVDESDVEFMLEKLSRESLSLAKTEFLRMNFMRCLVAIQESRLFSIYSRELHNNSKDVSDAQ